MLAGIFFLPGLGAALADNPPQQDVSTEEVVSHAKKLEKEADKYFYAGLWASEDNSSEAYLLKALARYTLLLRMQPNNAVYCTQIAIIHDVCHRPAQAKEYFYRAVNSDNLNPYANFYFAEYYFINKDYKNALKYYLTAYDNGYKDYYQVNYRIATVYERLGDIEKAKYYYSNTNKLNPALDGLDSKIQSLDKVYYSRKDYVYPTSGSKI